MTNTGTPAVAWRSVPVEPTAEMLEPFARVLCLALGIDPDEPVAPHGEWPQWYDNCAPLAVAYRDALAAAPAPDVREGIVEAVNEWLMMPDHGLGPRVVSGCNFDLLVDAILAYLANPTEQINQEKG